MSEQRVNLGVSVASEKGAIVLFARGGRLSSSSHRGGTRVAVDGKGSAGPGLLPLLTSTPAQTVKPSARPTRNDLEPRNPNHVTHSTRPAEENREAHATWGLHLAQENSWYARRVLPEETDGTLSPIKAGVL